MIGPCSGLFGLYGFKNGKRCHHVNFYCQLTLRSQKNCENLDFSTRGLCLAFKIFFGLLSIFMAFRHLEYSKLFKFELFWSNFAIKQFLLKKSQIGSVCSAHLSTNHMTVKISELCCDWLIDEQKVGFGFSTTYFIKTLVPLCIS